MFIFGVVGYLMRKLNLNTAAVVLALILGPIGEKGLRRSLTLSNGDISILFSTPICLGLIALSLLSVFSPLLMKKLKKS
jgi:putative tricarboxylic transport membrane protein